METYICEMNFEFRSIHFLSNLSEHSLKIIIQGIMDKLQQPNVLLGLSKIGISLLIFHNACSNSGRGPFFVLEIRR